MYKIEYDDIGANKFHLDHKNAVKDALQSEIDLLQSDQSSYGLAAKDLLLQLVKDDLIKKLLTSKPQELITLNDSFTSEIQKKITLKKDISSFIKIIKNIFVNRLYSESSVFSKIDFYESKKILVCPYCSQNYIFTFEKSNIQSNVQVKHHLDHFLHKSDYPLLAFSYYNLIPSCTTCNMSLCKGSKDPLGSADNLGKDGLMIYNPYEFDSEKIKFSFRLANFDTFEEKNFSIDYNFEAPYTIEAYQHFFGLRSLYTYHTPLIFELIVKKQFWSSCSNTLNYKDIINHPFSRNLIQAFFGFNINLADFGKRPLSKLMYDVSKHYDKLYKLGKNGKPELLDKIKKRIV